MSRIVLKLLWLYEEGFNGEDEGIDLSKAPWDFDVEDTDNVACKMEIDKITTVEALKVQYNQNKGKGEDLDNYLPKRKKEILW